MSYGGRLTQTDGAPVTGPVDLKVAFYGSVSGGDSVHPALVFRGITLAQGVFQLDLGLTADDIETLFGSGHDVYVEVTDSTHKKTYPRQRLSAVPYALRVPVDGKTLAFDSSGNLAVALPSGGAGEYLTVDGSGRFVWKAPPTTATGLVSLGATPAGLTTTDAGRAWFDSSGGQLKYWDGTHVQTLGSGGAGTTAAASLTALAPLSYAGGTLSLPSFPAASLSGTLSAGQVPGLPASQITSGTLPTSVGGTGSNATLAGNRVLVSSGGAMVEAAQLSFVAGNLGIGTTSASSTLDVAGAFSERGIAAPPPAPAGQGRIYFDATASQFMVSQNGGAYAPLGTVTGGTITQISPGTGLTGGGTSGNVTLGLATAGTAGTYVKVLTDAYGRVTAGGTLASADLPPISASLVSGTFVTAQIPTLDASKITTGTLAPAVIPPLSEGQITSGTLAVALGGTGGTSFTNNGVVIGGGAGPLSATAAGSQYQVLTVNGAGQPVFGPLNLDQSAGVTGALSVANGGTGSTTALTGNRFLVSSGSAIVEAPSLSFVNGNVGLGTTSAASTLEVVNPSATASLSLRGAAASNAQINLDADGSTTDRAVIIRQTGANGNLVVRNASTGAAHIVVDTSGKVGIGTSSPGVRLHVLDGGVNLLGNEYMASGLFQKTGNGGVGFGYKASDTGGFIYSNGGNSYLAFLTNNAGTSAEVMRIGSTGTVGIGTMTPGSLLSVYSPAANGVAVNLFDVSTANHAPLFSVTQTSSGQWPLQLNLGAGDLYATSGRLTGAWGLWAPLSVIGGTGWVQGIDGDTQTRSNLLLRGGNPTGANVDGGSVTIGGGSGAGTGNGGNLLLDGGAQGASGAPGNVLLATTRGSVGIGTTAPGTALDVAGALTQRGIAAPAAAPAGQGRLYFDVTTNQFLVSQNGGAYAPLSTLTALGSAGNYTKVLTDAYGRVTAGTSLASADLPPVPLSSLPSIPATQITGTLAGAQVGALAPSQISGTLAATQLPSIPATQITGTLASAQINWSSPGAIGSVTPNSAAFTGVAIGSPSASSYTLDVNGYGARVTGTSSDTLDVVSASTDRTGIRIANTDTGGHTYKLFSAGSASATGVAAGGFGLWDGSVGALRLVVSGTGNVGIGSATPGAKLDVAGNAAVSGALGVGTAAPASGLKSYSSTTHQLVASGWDPMNGANASNGSIAIGSTSAFQGILHYNQQYGTLYLDSSYDLDAARSFAFRTKTAGASTVDAVTIFGNGFVGIGTTSAAGVLDVEGNNAEMILKGNGGTGNVAYHHIVNSGGAFDVGVDNLAGTGFGSGSGYSAVLYNEANTPMAFYTNSQLRMLISSTGNLGVGTTSPLGPLDVRVAADQHVGMLTQGSAATVAGWKDAGASTKLRVVGNPLELSGNGSTTHLTLDSSGNVGIGTATPQAMLDLAKDNPVLRLSDTGAGGTNWLIGNGLDGNGILAFRDNGTSTTRMAITNAGNVGIGTVSPTAALDVNGQIRAASYNVATANATAFDFNNGNVQYNVQSGAGSGTVNITLSNLLDGGAYTVSMQSTQGATYNFQATGLTFKYLPTNAATTSGKDTVYTFIRVGSTVYVSWITGF